ncbi:MAG: NUDIX domain-containing protein [Gemmatimonadales bacterium]
MPDSRGKVRTETQISAGGCVLRRGKAALEVVLISVGTPPRWQLPKGLIDSGEKSESAAIREVREEAGIEATIAELIEKVEYWYQATHQGERVRYHKYVYFFLMWYAAGDVANHDDEVNEARWFPADEAVSALAFKSERDIILKALKLAG